MVLAYLLPNPPPKQFWNPVKHPKFTIFTADGSAEISAYGCDGPINEYKIDNAGTSNVVCDNTLMEMISSGKWLTTFRVRGLCPGDQIALFRNVSGVSVDPDTGVSIPKDDWKQISEFMAVDFARAQWWGSGFAPGSLPAWSKNKNITFYPYGSMQHEPPIKETDWLAQVSATLDNIYSNPLGKAVIDLVQTPIKIHSYIASDTNANSSICFTPSNFSGIWKPGATAEEILFHEFIHVLEKDYSGYHDVRDDFGAYFSYDQRDFNSVNATNVYSCLLGHALRKDHQGYEFLPEGYAQDPKRHFDLCSSNYNLANQQNSKLCQVLKDNSNFWNPYKFL